MHLVRERGDENDGGMSGFPASTNEPGGFQAIHPGHVDIKQDDREFALQHLAQRIRSGPGSDDVLTQFLQDGLQHEQLLGEIVDDQDANLVVVHQQLG